MPGGELSGLLISGALPQVAWPGCLPLRRISCGYRHRDRAPGDSPARRSTVIPRGEGQSEADRTRTLNLRNVLKISAYDLVTASRPCRFRSSMLGGSCMVTRSETS